MWLGVEHTTVFAYDEPIAEAYTELRLRPQDDGGQRCSSFLLNAEPPEIDVQQYADPFGNTVHNFDVLEPHDRLTLVATSGVFTPDGFIDTPGALTMLEQHDYRSPTSYTPSLAGRMPELDQGDDSGSTVAERTRALMGAVSKRLVYERGVTDVQTTADEVIALGRGVCQDFAHVMLATCRSVGIPARYVSGYLYDPSLRGDNAASHAWVDVWDDTSGWTALDPTHDREQSEAYVRVAVGRDYADVPPTRGVFKGAAHETLSVRVGLHAL
jgi:transglutaminase-like putative cysteine protease